MTRVEFSTNAYRFSHGKSPRGFGAWAFSFGHGDTRFAPRAMSYADAKAWATDEARRANVRHVEVQP